MSIDAKFISGYKPIYSCFQHVAHLAVRLTEEPDGPSLIPVRSYTFEETDYDVFFLRSFVSFSHLRRVVASVLPKNGSLELDNRKVAHSFPRNNVVRLTDPPDMT